MKRLFFLTILLICFQNLFAQTQYQQTIAIDNPHNNETEDVHSIEAFVMPGFFTAQLSNDSLVPPKYRNHSRLGDEANFGIQYGRQFGNHILLKAGIGFSAREYSLVKYNVNDILGALFIFGSQGETDSFPISRVQYKIKYVDLPFTIQYEKGGKRRAVQLKYGLTARLQFSTNKKATITTDAAYFVYSPTAISTSEKQYTENINAVVVSVEPYGILSVRLYKQLSVYYSLMPFSLYASSIDHRITKSQAEFLGSGFGISYSF